MQELSVSNTVYQNDDVIFKVDFLFHDSVQYPYTTQFGSGMFESYSRLSWSKAEPYKNTVSAPQLLGQVSISESNIYLRYVLGAPFNSLITFFLLVFCHLNTIVHTYRYLSSL